MSRQHFIFSDKKNDRILRHLLFWILWGTYFISLHIASPFLNPKDSHFNNIPYTATEGFLIFVFLIPICYGTLYLIQTFYIKQKKLLKTIVCLVIAWIAFYFFYQYALGYFFSDDIDTCCAR